MARAFTPIATDIKPRVPDQTPGADLAQTVGNIEIGPKITAIQEIIYQIIFSNMSQNISLNLF
jgi:hypothetical protein